MKPEGIHLAPAPDAAPGAVPRVHVWLNWSPYRLAREYAARIVWYSPPPFSTNARELRWFEKIINRGVAPLSLGGPVVLYAELISALRPAVHELLHRFIREADAPGAPWPPVNRRRVHVVVDGTRAELEELLGETVLSELEALLGEVVTSSET